MGSLPPLMLGGIPLQLHAGSVELSEQPLGGETSLRLSGGRLVTQRHWERMAGTISGAGFQPPALDGLDFSQHHELRSTKVRSVQSAGASVTLPADPRPDKAPWAWAYFPNGEWVSTPCSAAGRAVTITPVAGATVYQVWFLPVYQVKCSRPTEGRTGANYNWSISWEEA